MKLGFENVKTNLSLGEILSYLIYAIEFNPENLKLEQIPGKSVYTNGIWIFSADKSQTKKIFENLNY